MKNYSKVQVVESARTELHDKLDLTGSEISFNEMKGNTNVPFVHAHKENEEVYIILSGEGKFVIDGEDISVKQNDVIRVSPNAKRQIFAFEKGLKYICIQTKANSLTEYTVSDVVIF